MAAIWPLNVALELWQVSSQPLARLRGNDRVQRAVQEQQMAACSTLADVQLDCA